jgi:hypothetical protein
MNFVNMRFEQVAETQISVQYCFSSSRFGPETCIDFEFDTILFNENPGLVELFRERERRFSSYIVVIINHGTDTSQWIGMDELYKNGPIRSLTYTGVRG